jgi:hypothetical protein
MKNIKTRLILKGRNKHATLRTAKELVLAEVSAGFKAMQNATAVYSKFQISLECQIKPQHFGLDDSNYKFDKDVFEKYSKQNAAVKTRIRTLEAAIDAVDNHFTLIEHQPSAQEFKKELFVRLGREKRKTETKKIIPSVLSFLRVKIETDEKNINSNRKDEIKDNSIKTYRTLEGYIEKYQQYTGSVLQFADFDKEQVTWWNFWDVQDDILRGKITLPKIEGKRKQTHLEYGFTFNSVKKYQSALCKVLKLARKQDIDFALDVTDTNLIVKSTPSHKDLYINQAHLQKIIDCKPTTPELQEAKDYVILASLTGMRYQSMAEAHISQIEYYDEDGYDFNYIHSKQGKTNTECMIPLLKPVLEITQRHGNQFPKFSENATINKSVKILFEIFDISVKETIYSYKSGVIARERNINELVSTHDFRKSFYTNLNLMKVTDTVIDGITHPDKVKENAMSEIYNVSTMLDKAKLFVDEIHMATSNIYTF